MRLKEKKKLLIKNYCLTKKKVDYFTKEKTYLINNLFLLNKIKWLFA